MEIKSHNPSRAFPEERMAKREPRYSPEEFSRRGQEIYDRVVRPDLRPDDDNKFVAIDIETNNYEMDFNDYTAVDRLLKRLPDAQIWLMRVGHRAAHRFGRRLDAGGTA
jgi:hypothetical protein